MDREALGVYIACSELRSFGLQIASKRTVPLPMIYTQSKVESRRTVAVR